MPDSYILTGPDGATSLEVATYTQADGVDLGAAGLLKAGLFETSYNEGGLVNESVGPRRMRFPLILRGSYSIPGLGLEGQETLLRKLARPGAWIDVKPHGASAAVRFDILAARYEQRYDVFQNRAGVRLGDLLVDTQPYGYWPTWITLASGASVGLPGLVRWNGGVITGDAPAEFRIVVQPTYLPASQWTTVGSWHLEGLTWAFGTASYDPRISASAAADMQGIGSYPVKAASWITTDSEQYAAVFRLSPTVAGSWFPYFQFDTFTPTKVAPLRGRHRLFLMLNTNTTVPHQFIADFVSFSDDPPIPTHRPIATVTGGTVTPTLGYGIYDMGEVTIASSWPNAQERSLLRVWGQAATTNLGAAPTPMLFCNGAVLVPLDNPNGILQKGLTIYDPLIHSAVPGPSLGRFVADAGFRAFRITSPAANLGSDGIEYRRGALHYGVMPVATTEVEQLSLSGIQRQASAAGTASGALSARVGPVWGAVSVQYRPRFQFLEGVV